MKLKNCVVGQRVKVKDQDNTGFYSCLRGKEGVIVNIDDLDNGRLNVRVHFDDVGYDWGSHKALKKVKGE